MDRRWKVLVVIVAVVFLAGPTVWRATRPAPRTIAVDTPVYVGFDAATRTHHFRLVGHPASRCRREQCVEGAPAGMLVRFSGSVDFELAVIRTYDRHGHLIHERTRKTNSFSSFRNAEARIDDGHRWKRMTVDIWIRPDPTEGSCYDHLLLNGSDLRSGMPSPNLVAPKMCIQ